ncbi:MAG: DUF4388 domain-containing protein [Blastocatellia bacterium]
MGHGRDRRDAKRVSYICEIECEAEGEVGGSTRITTRLRDLSLSGAFIDSTTCFAPGSILLLTFQAAEMKISTSAEVRYTMPESGMGVRFVGLTSEQTAALERLIEEEPLSADDSNTQRKLGQKLFLGSFTVISLLDVIQMIENSRLTGVLAIFLPSTKGEIYFSEGEIVGAAADGESGAEGLARLLNAAEGTFEFRKSPAHFERTIDAPSNVGLLLDLLRVKDEESNSLLR